MSATSVVPSRRLLRLKDTSNLSIGTKTLRSLILSGAIKYVQLKPGNSPFLLDVRDLDNFIESRKTSNAAVTPPKDAAERTKR